MANIYTKYLYSRGLTDETISVFELGFYTEAGRVSDDTLVPFVDSRFRDSVLFPIRDVYGTLVAVSSRSPSNKIYIHTTYPKRKHFYGLNITFKEILKTGKAYVVEGNFDLLTLYQNGIKNVVAMLGSTLSAEQLALLTRFADTVVLAADGDEAGKVCANKFKSMARMTSAQLHVLNLPPKFDPDLFVKQEGPEAFLKLSPKDLSDRLRSIVV